MILTTSLIIVAFHMRSVVSWAFQCKYNNRIYMLLLNLEYVQMICQSMYIHQLHIANLVGRDIGPS